MLRHAALVVGLAVVVGTGVGGTFTCPGVVFVRPGGVTFRPRSFFACPGGSFECPGDMAARWRNFFAFPGGVLACPGGPAEVGGRRAAGTGDGAGRGDGSGLTGTVAGGGGDEEVEACFGRATLTVGVGCAVTGASGVATTPGGGDVVRSDVCRRVVGTVGA